MFHSNTTINKCFTILENLLPQYITFLIVHYFNVLQYGMTQTLAKCLLY
jgi:hypothetical protein